MESSGAVGSTALDAMRKGMKLQERQMTQLLESATMDQTMLNHNRKASELAAKTSGVGTHINVLA